MIFGLFWMHGVFFRETYDTAVFLPPSLSPLKKKLFSFFSCEKIHGENSKGKNPCRCASSSKGNIQISREIVWGKDKHDYLNGDRNARIFDRSGKFVWKDIRWKFKGASLRFPQKRNKTFSFPSSPFYLGVQREVVEHHRADESDLGKERWPIGQTWIGSFYIIFGEFRCVHHIWNDYSLFQAGFCTYRTQCSQLIANSKKMPFWIALSKRGRMYFFILQCIANVRKMR